MGKYLVAVDDGHGMETAGKRSPKLTDGSVMKENEFNKAVVAKLKENLKRCGIDIVATAPTTKDTPLKDRVKVANDKKADIFVSVHANAYDGTFEGKNPSGVETFYHANSENGKKIANLVHNNLIQGIKQVDRGIKTGDLYVLNHTNMPAILCECGFMDNPGEIKLLLSDSFREECAEEIARGICEYFGVKFIDPFEVESKSKKLHHVQVGAFEKLENAERLSRELQSKGYKNKIV